jgi:hypothetical protein
MAAINRNMRESFSEDKAFLDESLVFSAFNLEFNGWMQRIVQVLLQVFDSLVFFLDVQYSN